jgi:hypothetical protein
VMAAKFVPGGSRCRNAASTGGAARRGKTQGSVSAAST